MGYRLPWQAGLRHGVVQGWNGSFSHQCSDGPLNGTACYAYDFDLAEGTPVLAAQDGRVAFAVGSYTACGGWEYRNDANRVVLYHTDGTATLYLHLKSVSVRLGQNVKQGQLLGRSGKTGFTDCGAHLHFQRQAQGSWWTQSKKIYFDEYPGLQLREGTRYTSHNSGLPTAHHFYTTSPAERDNAVAHYGFTFEGTAGYVFETQQPSTTDLYRLVNAQGDHFYTISAAERDEATAHGYTLEGTACYVFGAPEGPLAFYRLFNAVEHFYTRDLAERDKCIAGGYTSEGTACYVFGTQEAGTTDLYRLVDGHGHHFYTRSAEERDNAVAQYGFTFEGTAGYVFETQQPSTTDLYRLVNEKGDHFYTISAAERDNAVAQGGYTFEGTACYVFGTPEGPSPFYRLFNADGDDHFYTLSLAERDNAIAHLGYTSEGTACYVFETQQPGTSDLYRLVRAQ